MPAKTSNAKEYSTTTIKGVEYFRTRITGADGKRVTLYARTSEELAQKVQDAKHEIVEAKFHKENPTVAEYCQKWLVMQSAKVKPATLKDYESKMRNYIIKPLGELYMSDVCQRRGDFVVFRRTENVEKWRVKVYSLWIIILAVFACQA